MEAFDNAYEGTPTWELGRPQGAVVRLAEAGVLAGDVLDVGCGTGDAALFLAGRGCRVVGVDFSARAIERAGAKLAERTAATERGGAGATQAPIAPIAPVVEFVQANALELASVPALRNAFDVAIDVGLFHTLQPADRRRYAEGLAACVRGGGAAYVLCWSDRNPFGFGPERIRRADLRAAFRNPWFVERIDVETLETRLPRSIHAWLGRMRRR